MPWLLMALATSSPAVDVRFEVAPLVAVPLGPLLDGLPVSTQFDFTESGYPDLGVQDAIVLSELSAGTGGGFSVSVLLDAFELRYELVGLAFERLRLTNVNFPNVVPLVYFDARDFDGRKSVDVSNRLESMLVHHLLFGYRFAPFRWHVRPVLPVAIGFAAAQLRNGADTLFGLNLQVGLGVDWDITRALRLGATLRFSFGAFKNSDTSLGGVEGLGIQSALTNESAFEAVMETLRMVTVSVTLSYGL